MVSVADTFFAHFSFVLCSFYESVFDITDRTPNLSDICIQAPTLPKMHMIIMVVTDFFSASSSLSVVVISVE